MIEAPPERILVPEGRYRKAFPEKEMADLEASILQIGLLHPPTVELSVLDVLKGDGREHEHWILRAGERRLRVLKKILSEGKTFKFGTLEYYASIPCVNYNELTDLERVEIEVQENLNREEFHWKERVAALARLHELRKAHNPEQTATATATEFFRKGKAEGSQISAASDALILAGFLEDPDVVKAKSSSEAMKIVRKKADIAHRAKLSVNYKAQETVHAIILGDAQQELGKLSEGSFDCILTDPPYGVGADSFGDMASLGHEYSDTKKTFDQLLTWLPEGLFRVSKPAAHAYVFCDLRRFEELHTHMVLAGWKVFNVPLIWDKCGSGMLPFPEHGPRRTYECVLYAWKGEKRVLSIQNDVIRVPAIRDLVHGAQKPVALYTNLLARSCTAGDRVLDCFGGSGTILVAANVMKLHATYVEKDEAQYHIALQRQSEMQPDDAVQEDDGISLIL